MRAPYKDSWIGALEQRTPQIVLEDHQAQSLLRRGSYEHHYEQRNGKRGYSPNHP